MDAHEPSATLLMVPPRKAVDTSHPLPRLVALTAALTAIAGIGTEIATRRLIRPGHSVWLIRPVLYVGLPETTAVINWSGIIVMAALFAVGLFLALVARSAPTYPAPWIRIGIGLILGGTAGQAATGIALYTKTHILAARLGAWEYAFSPFELAILVGFLLVIPEFFLPGSRLLRDPKAPLDWRRLVVRDVN